MPATQRKPYLRRFIPSDEPAPFSLQDGDVEILKHLAERRFLTLPMLQLLTGRAYTNLSIRLKKMFHQPAENRLVGKPPQQKHYSRARNSPVVFALANAGARLLMDMGLMEKGRLDWNRNNDAVQHPHIDHELLINTVSICVERGIESTKGAELVMSQRAFANKMRVYIPEQRRSKSFEMDWWYLVQLPDESYKLLLLEADRGTMTLKDFGAKVSAYWQFHVSGAAPKFFANDPNLKKLGIRGLERFQVVTVVSTPKDVLPEDRRDNLVKEAKNLANAPRGSYQYLFASHRDVSLDDAASVFRPIFRCPVDYDPQSDTFNDKWYGLLD